MADIAELTPGHNVGYSRLTSPGPCDEWSPVATHRSQNCTARVDWDDDLTRSLLKFVAVEEGIIELQATAESDRGIFGLCNCGGREEHDYGQHDYSSTHTFHLLVYPVEG